MKKTTGVREHGLRLYRDIDQPGVWSVNNFSIMTSKRYSAGLADPAARAIGAIGQF